MSRYTFSLIKSMFVSLNPKGDDDDDDDNDKRFSFCVLVVRTGACLFVCHLCVEYVVMRDYGYDLQREVVLACDDERKNSAWLA